MPKKSKKKPEVDFTSVSSATGGGRNGAGVLMTARFDVRVRAGDWIYPTVQVFCADNGSGDRNHKALSRAFNAARDAFHRALEKFV